MAKSKDDDNGAVLIVRFSALGDVAISVPVVYSLCHAYPARRFVMLTSLAPSRIWMQTPPNLTVVGADIRGRYKGVRGLWRLSRELRRDHNVTGVADLHSVLRSWIVDIAMCLHGITVVRIHKGRAEKRALVSGRISRQLASSHDRYMAVLRRLGFNFKVSFSGYKGITSHLVPVKKTGERWVAVAPFSQHRGKELPLATVEEVIARLTVCHDVRVWLMGGGDSERQRLHAMAMRHEHVTSMADVKHDFADEFALFGQCDVMLSMDSANMHLSSLCGLPVVSVWGATHPFCGFMGWNQSEADAVQVELPCRPCSVFGQKPCRFRDYRCLTSITVDKVMEKLDKYVGKR